MRITEVGPEPEVLDVLRELRPDLTPDGVDYRLAAVFEDDACRAVAGFWVRTNTSVGRRMYVEDLVTADGDRSKGYGAALLRWLEDRAREEGCRFVTLDSGVRRFDAHRFYHREGYVIVSHHFAKRLEG